ncbi:MAG: isocitrate lyase/PEP mutase family protein [Solirubrobacteraceae bacterium]
MEGKAVIPTDEMVLKVRAAVDARRNPDTLIIARTDALQVNGLDDAIERCNAYAEAGADVTFVDAPRSREQLEEIARRVDGLSMSNMSETGRTPPLTADELQQLGYSIVIFPSTQTWLFAHSYQELLEEVITTGTSRGMLDRMMAFDDVNELLGLSRWQS